MIDDKDRLLLHLLRKNGRITLKEMNKETGIPISTVHDRIRKIEKRGLVRHTSLLDFSKVGSAIHVYLSFMKTEKDQEFLSFLETHERINSVFRVNSGFSYLLECIFPSMKDLRIFTENLESFGAVDLSEHHVIEEIKREQYMP